MLGLDAIGGTADVSERAAGGAELLIAKDIGTGCISRDVAVHVEPSPRQVGHEHARPTIVGDAVGSGKTLKAGLRALVEFDAVCMVGGYGRCDDANGRSFYGTDSDIPVLLHHGIREYQRDRASAIGPGWRECKESDLHKLRHMATGP